MPTIKNIRASLSGAYTLQTFYYAAGEMFPEQEETEIEYAVALDGGIIGEEETALYLTARRGIVPQKAAPDHRSTSIGYCRRQQLWFGWNDKQLVGFGVGDRLFDPNWPHATESTPPEMRGEVVIETLEQAKQAACNFARTVM